MGCDEMSFWVMLCLLSEKRFRFGCRVLDLPFQMRSKLVYNLDVWTSFIDVGEPVLHSRLRATVRNLAVRRYSRQRRDRA